MPIIKYVLLLDVFARKQESFDGIKNTSGWRYRLSRVGSGSASWRNITLASAEGQIGKQSPVLSRGLQCSSLDGNQNVNNIYWQNDEVLHICSNMYEIVYLFERLHLKFAINNNKT